MRAMTDAVGRDPPTRSSIERTAVPTPLSPVDAAETHISRLFFTPERVFKFLKPIRTGFLDHTDASRRVAAIDAELELNRRLAGDVYLGTGDMHEAGELVDRCLIMRRLPEGRRLSALTTDPDFDQHLREVARAIAVFHAGLLPVYEPVPLSTASGLLSFWSSSFDEMTPDAGGLLVAEEFEEVRRLATSFLGHHDELMAGRRQEGFVRDGHGDLIADDIFMLADGPRILDCLAFDAALRTSDVLADVAFLAMDLEHFAGWRASRRLMVWYDEFTDWRSPPGLLHHYIAYRAHIRAKVALLRHRQGAPDAPSDLRRYHDQALRHLRAGQGTMMLVGGAPGTGKTTLAQRLSDSLDWCVLNSDTLRKDLYGVDHHDHRVDEHPQLYDAKATAETYSVLISEASTLLARGESVLLDATWASQAHRRIAEAAARHAGSRLVQIECRLDRETVRRRLRGRAALGYDASDATPEIADRLSTTRDPWPDALGVDTSDASDEICARLIPSVAPHALEAPR